MEFYQPGMKLDKTQRGMAQVHAVEQSDIIRADNAKLAELGYRSEFRREFSVRQTASRFLCCVLIIGSILLQKRFETIAFGISIMGLVSAVTSTFSFGLFNGLNLSLLYHIRHVEP